MARFFRSATAFSIASLLAAGCAAEEAAVGSSEDDLCIAGLGRCAPPPVACASELGKRVMARAYRADFSDSTVPRDLAYGGRNRAEEPLVDAIRIFPKMADVIASARREVDYESFEWAPSDVNLSLTKDGVRKDAAAFAADPSSIPAAMRDPTVVLLSGLVRLEDRLRAEEKAGRAPTLPVRAYFSIDGAKPGSPISSHLAVQKVASLRQQLAGIGLDSRYVEVHTAAHGALLGGALHSKQVVVDGYRAVITGANAQSQQTVGSSWHDTGYAITGDAAIGLQRSFDTMWMTANEVTSCESGDATTCTQTATRSIVRAPGIAKSDLEADTALDGACLPVFVATRKPSGFSGGLSTANPLAVSSPQDQAFLALMGEARSAIKIESPNLNAPGAKSAIVDAVRRGVRVRVILSMGFNNDAEQKLGGSNQDTVRELYRSVAREPSCRLLEMAWSSADGQRPTWANEQPGATHAKYMSIDGQIVMVGSANQDLASWGFAYETNVVIDDAKTTMAYDAAVFDADWRRAQPVTTWASNARGDRPVVPVLREGGTPATDAERVWLLGSDPARWLADVADACSSAN